MNPKKKLPEGAEKIAVCGRFILVRMTADKRTYYSIYQFFESSQGLKYLPRGGGGEDLEQVKQQWMRITGESIVDLP